MFKTLTDAFKVKEIRRGLIFTLFILAVVRMGCWIPIPGLSSAA